MVAEGVSLRLEMVLGSSIASLAENEEECTLVRYNQAPQVCSDPDSKCSNFSGLMPKAWRVLLASSTSS